MNKRQERRQFIRELSAVPVEERRALQSERRRLRDEQANTWNMLSQPLTYLVTILVTLAIALKKGHFTEPRWSWVAIAMVRRRPDERLRS